MLHFYTIESKVTPNMADLPEFNDPDNNKQYPFVNTGMDMYEP